MDDLRVALGEAIRSRVAGPGGTDRAAELLGSRGARWFAEDRPIRRVHADASMFVGGLRALLLQTLHPLAMAGVAEHSDYRRDPWGRLQRTADFLAATTFGNAAQAEAAVARVRAVHTRVVGTAPDGRAYSAGDPHLLRWVHLTEVDSFLVAHDRFGAERLGADARDAYVADMAVIARRLGVPAPPESARGLRDQLRAFRPELHATPAARDAARYLLVRPPMPLAARPVYGLVAAAAVSLLPGWARRSLQLPVTPVLDTAVARPGGAVVVAAIRWALAPSAYRADDAASRSVARSTKAS